MNLVPGAINKGRHFRVPAVGLMSKMHASLQKLNGQRSVGMNRSRQVHDVGLRLIEHLADVRVAGGHVETLCSLPGQQRFQVTHRHHVSGWDSLHLL